MSAGYKLRLPDGSEIGPMDLEEVKTWYRRRLVGEGGLVLRPGGTRWVPLRQVIPLDELRKASSPVGPSEQLWAAARAAAAPRSAAGPRREARAGPVEAQTWRTILTGALALLAAAGSAFWALAPDRWTPALDETPWREIALGEAALGLLLIRGWEPARKIARFVLLLAAAALPPVAGILVAQHAPRPGLFVVASAFVFLLGLVAMLVGGWLTPWHVALRLLIVLVGAAGVLRFGLVAEPPGAGPIREWALTPRRFQDSAKGIGLDLPRSWVALKPEQKLVPAGPGTWLVLAQPRLDGRAILGFDTPHATLATDEFLGRALALRNLPARTELGRSDVLLGALRGRQVTSRWEKEGARFLDVTVAAKDGGTYWSLAAWVPDDGSTRPERELQALVAGLDLDGRTASRLAAAVQAATDDVPLLSPSAAEVVMAGAESSVLDPPAAFRRTLELASGGLATLSAAETRELEVLEAAAWAALSKPERDRLLAYRSRVRVKQAGSSEEDLVMAGLMKRAVLSLPSADRLARLQALYEKAIRAAAEGPRP